MSTVSEVDVLRSQVAELSRELAARDQTLREHSRHRDREFQDLREQSQQLRALIAGTADGTGEDFFQALVTHLTSVLGVQYAVIGEVRQDTGTKKIHTMAVAAGGALVDNFEYDLLHTPCETALASSFACFEQGVQASFPLFSRLGQLNVEGYCGVSIRAKSGAVIGLLVVMDIKPIGDSDWLRSVLTLFASRAAAELERARAEQERSQALTDLHQVMEAVPDVLFTLDLQGSLVRWNYTLERVTGYSADELLNKHALEFVPPAEHEPTASAIQQALRDGYAELTGHLLTKDGRTIPYHWTGARLNNHDGHVIGLTGVGRDITVRKQEEEERVKREMLLSLMLSTGPGCIKRVAADGTLLSMNPAGLCMIELDERDAIGRSVFDLVVPEHRALFIDMHQAVIAGTSRVLQFELKGGQGTRRWMETHAVPFLNPVMGSTEHLAVTHDITERKAMERQRHEQAERLRLAMDMADLATWDWDISTNSVIWSENCEQVKRLPPGTFDGTFEAYQRLVHHDDLPTLFADINRALAGPDPYRTEHRIVPPGGDVQWIEGNGVVSRNESGQPIRMVGTVRNTTARRCAEESLRISEERLALAVEGSTDVLWDAHRIPGQPWHAPETPIWWSPRVRQLLDLEDGESFDTLMQWAARLHPDDTNHVFARLTAHIEQRVPYDVDYRLRSNQGEYRWVRGRGQAIWNEQGELSRMSGSCQDITDRKLAEVALRVSEERFATAFNEASIGMALVSTDGHWFEVNQALCQIVGYSKEELQQTTFQALTHPDDLPKSLLLLERLLSGDLRTHQMEKRYLHKGGHIVWVNLNASSVRNHEGQVLYQIAQIQDITERKQAEEALRVSEERWQLAVRGSNDGIWDWMVQTGEVFYSTRWKTMRGFEEHEIRNHDEEWRNRIHPEDLDRVLRAVDAYLSKQIHEFYEEYRIQKKDGSYMWVLDRGMAIWADDGTPLRMAGSETDITARRQMEAELAEREERLRLLIEHSPVALAMLDHEMRYIAVSQRWRSDYRVGDGSLVGQSHYEVFPDIPERWKAIHRRCLAGAVEGCEEDPFIRTDGRTDWSRWEIRPWRTVEGSVGGIIIFSEDITARKQAEEALLVSQERYVRATVVGKVGVWELDVLQEQFHADDNLKALFGYSKDELSTDPFIWLNLVHPDDRAITLETWNQVSTGLVDSYSYEVRMIRKDGSIIWTHVRGQANRNDAGAVVRLIGATVDVTDRKCADERVLLTQFSIDRASDAVLWLDSGARIFNVNDAACRLLNYAREELTALSLYDLDPNVSTEGWALHWEELKQKETVTFESSYWSSTGQVVETEITSNYLQYGGKEYDCAIVRDITGRKHADAALRLAKFSMERAADAVYWIDPQARILDVNEAASLMLGYSKDELCAMTVHDLNPDFPAALWPGFWADTKQRGTMVLATAHRAKDGRLIPIEVSINYLAYEGQEYHCAFVRDITERKRAEQEVSERTQQTLTMQAALLRLTHLDETGGTPSDVLPRMCEIVAETLGVARVSVWLLSENGTALVCQNLYDRSQAVHSVGNRLSASQYPHYLETIAASLVLAAPDACADPRTIEFAEHYFLPLGITSMLDVPIRRQGTLVGVLWLEHVGVPRDWSPEAQSFGASVGEILGRMMETVERKRAESDLRQSHAFMRQVIDTDPNFIFAKDRDGRFTLVNQAVAEAYGTTVEGLIGKTDADFNLSPKEVAFFRQKDLEVMDSLQERFIPEEKITDVHGTSVGCKPSSGRL